MIFPDSQEQSEFSCVCVPSTGSLTDSGPSNMGCNSWRKVISSSLLLTLSTCCLTREPFISSTSYDNGLVILTMVPAINSWWENFQHTLYCSERTLLEAFHHHGVLSVWPVYLPLSPGLWEKASPMMIEVFFS